MPITSFAQTHCTMPRFKSHVVFRASLPRRRTPHKRPWYQPLLLRQRLMGFLLSWPDLYWPTRGTISHYPDLTKQWLLTVLCTLLYTLSQYQQSPICWTHHGVSPAASLLSRKTIRQTLKLSAPHRQVFEVHVVLPYVLADSSLMPRHPRFETVQRPVIHRTVWGLLLPNILQVVPLSRVVFRHSTSLTLQQLRNLHRQHSSASPTSTLPHPLATRRLSYSDPTFCQPYLALCSWCLASNLTFVRIPV